MLLCGSLAAHLSSLFLRYKVKTQVTSEKAQSWLQNNAEARRFTQYGELLIY